MKRIKYFGALLTFALLNVTAAHAIPITFTAVLSGGAEDPPNASPGSGSVTVMIDTDTNQLSIDAVWSGLVNTAPVGATPGTTVAHIHCCTAAPGAGIIGVAVGPGTLPGFPTNTLAGTYQVTLDLGAASTYSQNFINTFGGGTVQGAEDALFAGLVSGSSYFNIHSAQFPAGEIRGFLEGQEGGGQTPAPATLALLGLGLLGLGLSRRRRTAYDHSTR